MAEKMIERIQAVTKKISEEFDRDKLIGAPKSAVYAEIKEEADKYRKKTF